MTKWKMKFCENFLGRFLELSKNHLIKIFFSFLSNRKFFHVVSMKFILRNFWIFLSQLQSERRAVQVLQIQSVAMPNRPVAKKINPYIINRCKKTLQNWFDLIYGKCLKITNGEFMELSFKFCKSLVPNLPRSNRLSL